MNELPDAIALMQNYPNPFNPSTSFEYRLERPSHVLLTIHNILGQEVRRLVDGPVTAGNHQVSWDGREGSGRTAPSGVYIYRLSADDEVRGRTMHLVK